MKQLEKLWFSKLARKMVGRKIPVKDGKTIIETETCWCGVIKDIPCPTHRRKAQK